MSAIAVPPEQEVMRIEKHPQYNLFATHLQKMIPQFQMALPPHIKPEAFYRAILTTLQAKPELMSQDPKSLLMACMTCAQMGLDPNPQLGQAWFVPFGNKITFIPGYKGYIYLARNSGEIASISAQVVRKGDQFKYQFGLHEDLQHIPSPGCADKPITHVWAMAKYKNGEHYFDVMTIDEVEHIRQKAVSKNSPAWKDYYSAMCKKTVIRQISKFLPLSVQKVASYDEAIDRGALMTFDHGEMVIHEPEQPPISSGSKLDQFTEMEGKLSVNREAIDKLTEAVEEGGKP